MLICIVRLVVSVALFSEILQLRPPFGQDIRTLVHVIFSPLLPPQPLLQRLLATIPRRQRLALIPVPRNTSALAVRDRVGVSRWPLLDGQARRAAQRHGRALVPLPGSIAFQLLVLQHGGGTGIRPVKDGLPLGARLLPKGALEEGPHGRPLVKVEALLLQAPAGQAHALDEQAEELGLQGADRVVLAVLGLVRLVVGAPAVEEVPAAAAGADARLEPQPRKGGEVRGAVDHVGLDDLPAAGGLAREQREQDALEEVGAAAGKVGEDVGRRVGRVGGAAEEAEGA